MFTKDELMALSAEKVHEGFTMMLNGASDREIESLLFPDKIRADTKSATKFANETSRYCVRHCQEDGGERRNS